MDNLPFPVSRRYLTKKKMSQVWNLEVWIVIIIIQILGVLT